MNESTTSTSVDHILTYEKGVQDGIEKLLEALRMGGEVLCKILEIVPSNEITIPVPVGSCTLEFTVKRT